MLEVVVCQEHLRDVQIVLREELAVTGHQAALSKRGAGLQLGQLSGALFVTERAHARADRAGGDQNELAPRLSLRGDLRDQLLHLRRVDLLAGIGEDPGAKLDDDSGDVFEQLAPHAAIKVARSGSKKPKLFEGMVVRGIIK